MIFTSSNISQSGVIQIPGFTSKVPSFLNPLTSQQAYFGFDASQNENYIHIKKADLLGLTPKLNNTAESLLAAIINRLITAVGNKRSKITVSYWGAVIENGLITQTVEIKLYSPLLIIEDEVQFSEIVFPMDY
jgi:hypothetical protein